MATYYWVGGNGTWNSTNTANWSLTSGGSGGAGFPTSADDVIFNSASNATAYTVTCSATAGVTVCRSLTISGPASGNVTIGTSSQRIDCYGSATTASTGVAFATNISIYFLATTTGNTVSLGVSPLNPTFVGTGDWTLGAALSCGSFSHTAGIFNTANYNITTSFNFTCNGSTTRTLNLGSSTITNTTNLIFTATGLTLSSGTSTITSGSASTLANGLTFYNFTINSGATVSCSSSSSTATFNNITANGGGSITGAITCADFTATSPASAGINAIGVTGSITATGTFTTNGSALTQRIFFYGGITGTAATISAATASISNTDFRDITAAGAASPFSASSGCGDCGGNTNISSFPAAKTVYWNLTGIQNWSATAWATSSGGSPSAANFPLAQDTATIDNAGAATTITYNAAFNIGVIDMSGRTNAATFAGSVQVNIYGNFSLGSGITRSYTGTLYFAARSTATLITAGKAMNGPTTIDCPGAGVTLGDAYSNTATTSNYPITLIQGTFNTANYNITSTGSGITTSGTLSKTLTLGSSTISITPTSSSSTVWWNLSASNLTLNAGTSSITVSSTAAIIPTNWGTGLTYYSITTGLTNVSSAPSGTSITCTNYTQNDQKNFNFITTTNYTFSYSVMPSLFPTWTNATFQPTAAGLSYTLAAGTYGNFTLTQANLGYFTVNLSGNVTFTGTITTSGTSGSTRNVIQSNTAGTTRTITAAAASLADVDFYWITGAGAASWSGTRLGDIGNISNITTDAPKTVYWNLSGAQNWNATGWAATSGGTPAANNYPLPQDTAVFDDTGSVTGNITMVSGVYYPTIDMSARTSAMTLVGVTSNFSGGIRQGTGTTISGASTFTFIGDNPAPIQCSGKTFANILTFSKVGGTATQQDAFSSSTSVSVTSGTYNANNYNFTASSFSSVGTNTRAVTMGSGTWTITGSAWSVASIGLTFSGASSTLSFTSASAITFAGGSLTYGTLNIAGGAATTGFTIQGNNTFANITNSRTAAYTLTITASTTQTISGNFISGSAGAVVTVASSSTLAYNLIYSGATYSSSDYVSISRATATPNNYKWFMGANSTNGGNDSGLFFTAPFNPLAGAFAAFFIR